MKLIIDCSSKLLAVLALVFGSMSATATDPPCLYPCTVTIIGKYGYDGGSSNSFGQTGAPKYMDPIYDDAALKIPSKAELVELASKAAEEFQPDCPKGSSPQAVEDCRAAGSNGCKKFVRDRLSAFITGGASGDLALGACLSKSADIGTFCSVPPSSCGVL